MRHNVRRTKNMHVIKVKTKKGFNLKFAKPRKDRRFALKVKSAFKFSKKNKSCVIIKTLKNYISNLNYSINK